MVVDHVAGLFHIGTIGYYLKVRRSVTLAQELAAGCAAAVIDGHYRHFTYHLLAVQICVEQGVQQRYHDKEHQHAHIGHCLAEFLTTYVKQIFYPHNCLFLR